VDLEGQPSRVFSPTNRRIDTPGAFNFSRDRANDAMLVSGEAGAGRTTLARQIARTTPAVLICEDEWICRLADPI
jgi:Flp pilus assembly CpaF family ATPase